MICHVIFPVKLEFIKLISNDLFSWRLITISGG